MNRSFDRAQARHLTTVIAMPAVRSFASALNEVCRSKCMSKAVRGQTNASAKSLTVLRKAWTSNGFEIIPSTPSAW